MSIFERVTGNAQVNMQEQLQQLKSNPMSMAQQAGYKIPDNLAGNPQAMVMHLIQSGQVGGPMLQKVMPMIQRLTGK